MRIRCGCLALAALLPAALAEKPPSGKGAPVTAEERMKRVALAQEVKSPHKDVRHAAAVSLSSRPLEKVDEDLVVAILHEGLRDPSASVREASARAIRNLSSRAGATTIRRLLEVLADRAPRVREEAACTLGNYGSRADSIRPALQSLAKHADAGVRATAVGVLGNHRFGLGRRAVPDLATALKDKDAQVRETAARCLWRIGAEARAALKALAGVAHGDAEVKVRQMAIAALAEMGPEAVPDLIELLGVRDERLRRAALTGLGKHGGRSKEAVPGLVRVVRDARAEYDTRYLAVYRLKEIGPPAREAVPALKELLKYPGTQMRQNAAEALRRIEGNAP